MPNRVKTRVSPKIPSGLIKDFKMLLNALLKNPALPIKSPCKNFMGEEKK